MNRRILVLIVSLFLFASFSVGCAGSPDTKDQALTADEARLPVYFDKIPANSPYIYTSLKPLPREVVEPYLMQSAELSMHLAEQFNTMGPGSTPDDLVDRYISALLAELGRADSPEALAEMGLSTSPHMAIYGIGYFPVVRATLDDVDAFSALLDRLDQKSGLVPQMRAAGKITYRQYDADGAKIAVAVADGQLIAGMAPAEGFDEFVGYMLGQKELGRTLADVNVIQDIQAQYEMSPYGVGFVDIAGIVNAVIGADSADSITVEMNKATGVEPRQLSEVCRAETIELAESMPRLVFGYTSVTTELIAFTSALEIKSPFAAELAAIGTSIPGYNEATLDDMLFTMGLGVDIKKAIDFANMQASRINEDPYQCEEFAYLNEGAQATGLVGMMPAFLSTLRGAFVGVQSVDINGGPDSAQAVALIGSSDPMSVFSQLRQFVPQLQNIQLKPDGIALSLPELAQENGLTDLFMVMTDKVLGASTGAGMKEAVTQRAKAEPAPATADPLLVFSYDYHDLIKMVGTQPGVDQSDAQALNAMGELFGLVVMKFYATDHALVMDMDIKVNPVGAAQPAP